ncbi:MAG: SDR family NAD(P)-dependent oxidoreductase [Pseudorhodoplanes sp.]
MGRLDGKIAIVTGAANGIGRAIAEGYAGEGARVVLSDIEESALEAACDAINRAYKDAAFPVVTDVADKASVDALAAKAVARFGRIDILLHSAAIWKGIPPRPFYDIPVDEWDRIFAVNTRGSFLCGAAVAPIMQAQKSGKIIFIGSDTPWTARGTHTQYASSKAALIALMRCMARELGPSFICVNMIHPGLTDTGGVDREYLEARSKQLRMLPNVQTPMDIVGAAVFFASNESNSITGQQLHIDGGTVLT